MTKNTMKAVQQITYAEALHEATKQAMEQDESVMLFGLGVPDPKGIFGTTAGLREQFGSDRVLDVPTSENAVTGFAVGLAIMGYRPILTHQRVEFALLSLDQIINQAAKWHYMTNGLSSVPMVIRLIIGRGWGQGPQHSQSLEPVFAHVPGLKVIAPATAGDAKTMMQAAIADNNPVMLLEHRWLHNTFGEVPIAQASDPDESVLGTANIVRSGSDATIVTYSYGTIEALRLASVLESQGFDLEVVDLRSLRPLDMGSVIKSVQKTRRLITLDEGWKFLSMGAEVVAGVVESSDGPVVLIIHQAAHSGKGKSVLSSMQMEAYGCKARMH